MFKKIFSGILGTGKEYIFSPIKGSLVPLEAVPDEVFASGMLGDGIAIEPSDGKVYAPCDGKIISFFPTGHAIGIQSDSGVEVIVHIGIDTVRLEGSGFVPMAKQDDYVKKGDLLLEFDLEHIKRSGYSTISPIIISNLGSHSGITVISASEIEVGEQIITLE